jgi:hypothetical protein
MENLFSSKEDEIFNMLLNNCLIIQPKYENLS